MGATRRANTSALRHPYPAQMSCKLESNRTATILAAIRRQARSSPHSRKMRPRSASGQVFTISSALCCAEGPMRMSSGPLRAKLNPLLAVSICKAHNRDHTARKAAVWKLKSSC